ncbi:MAG: SPFH domain-containing protein [Candidatus Cloacimonetes bacterium]|jgi:regulator of protease activity HflC (stomatin/prohibitin superfamily)|nr:SPFH domain-containing protein [Candidatus Cloacimonadota bacterium]
MRPRQIIALVLAGMLCLGLLLSVNSLFENLDAGQVMVIQSPISGNLAWYTTPGVKWQGFGKVTKYDRRSQFWFSARNDQGKPVDESIKIRFNDGGHAQTSGGISWEIPLDDTHLTAIHQKFGSTLALEQQLVKTIIQKSIYMTGPIMSSKESYAERRNELLNLIEDQIQNGVYLTRTIQEKAADPITGQVKTVAKVELVLDKAGTPKRAEDSPLKEFGIKVFNLSIDDVKYDAQVEDQISQQQKLTMQVQIAMADAKKAEQEALTTKKQGEANAAKAEWEQKTIMAKEVTKAEQEKKVAETLAQQKLAVAEFDTKAAQQFKLAETLRGEGEAARRKLVMEADGALEKKIEAYIEVNKFYADAIAKHEGAWVPSIIMGGSTQASGSGATDLINLLTIKAAKDLSLDMNPKMKVKGQPTPAPQ